MPKLKASSGAQKRFKKTGKGGYKHRQANRAHILTKKATKRKRHLRGMKQVSDADVPMVKRLLRL
jgi:large subunit ribosomal protein L35